jgi:hypothetical protein
MGMGQPRRRLGRPFEQACRLRKKSTDTATFLKIYSENPKLGEWVATQRSQYRRTKKERIAHDPPNPGIGKLGFRMGVLQPLGKIKLIEVDYRKVQALQCF